MTGINNYGIRNLEEEPSIDTTFSHIDYNHSNFPLVSPLLGNLFSKFVFFHRENKRFLFH
jgi:hypothetical protein